MTEFPKRARTIRWENDILIFDGERTIEMPELTMEIMKSWQIISQLDFM